MPRGDPEVRDYYRSAQEDLQEDVEVPMQASMQSGSASSGLQASTSSQQGVLNASHLPSPSGDRSSPSTQESVYDVAVLNEQDLGQAYLSHDDLNMGGWEMSNEVQPVAQSAVSAADLRRALADVSARISTQPSISPEQARLIMQVGQLLHPLANSHCKGTQLFFVCSI